MLAYEERASLFEYVAQQEHPTQHNYGIKRSVEDLFSNVAVEDAHLGVCSTRVGLVSSIALWFFIRN